MDFQLLLANGDDGRPTLAEGLPLETASAQPRPEGGQAPQHLYSTGGDPNSLPLQRWGVIAPEGPEGDRLLALIAPLRKAREEAQGAPARVYRVPASLDGLQAARWKDTVLHDEAVPESEQPRYLLLLGDLDQLSFELQSVLASDSFVGRLAFRSDEGYAAYVDKVLRWEKHPSPVSKPRALFYTAHDGSRATMVGYDALVSPSLKLCRERRERGDFPAASVLEVGDVFNWSAQQLRAQVAAPEPGLLFTMSHGMGAPKGGWPSLDHQRTTQGAMCLGPNTPFDATALGSTPFLPGGFWFFLACFSAGTPARSAYVPWLSRLREAGQFSGPVEQVLRSLPQAGERPFIAALPQAALAHPQGPLGVVGHVDLAWTYAFQDQGPQTRNRPSRILGVLRTLVSGHRAGVGLSALHRFFTEASVELTLRYDALDTRAQLPGVGTPPAPQELAHLWMLRQDLAGYILLGDPAVRLPLRQTEQEAVRPLASLPVPPPVPTAPPVEPRPAVEPAGPSLERMAEAVLTLISGEESAKAIAARLGVSLQELRRWEKVFTEAGTAALAKLRGGGGGP